MGANVRRVSLMHMWCLIVLLLASTVGCATTGRQEVVRLLATADAAYQREDWAAAEVAYRAVAARVPQEAYSYFRLGNLLARQVRLEDAAGAYREALVRDATHAKAYHNLAVVRLLQAEAALASALKHLSARDPLTPKTLRMQEGVKNVADIPLYDVVPPLSVPSGSSGSREKRR